MQAKSSTLPSSVKKKGKLMGSLGHLFSRFRRNNPEERTKRKKPLGRTSSDAGDLYDGFERKFGKGLRSSFHVVSPYDHISPNSVFSEDGIEVPARKNMGSVPSRPVAQHNTPPFDIPDKPKQVRPSLENIFDLNEKAADGDSQSTNSDDRRHPGAQTRPVPQNQSQLPHHTHSQSQDSSHSSDQEQELSTVKPREASRQHRRPKSTSGDSVASEGEDAGHEYVQ